MNICADCSYNLYPGTTAIAEQGYVGCDWRIKVEASGLFPPGLQTESGTLSEGWVGMNRYKVGCPGSRLINEQILIKDAVSCGRYSKET